ncbi:hypothetical protein BN871_AO_00420 [Paenibacillus sp. P22]|nr:hypothetical protein BN871_AO_00420 [Paenibacillus sp. P22]
MLGFFCHQPAWRRSFTEPSRAASRTSRISRPAASEGSAGLRTAGAAGSAGRSMRQLPLRMPPSWTMSEAAVALPWSSPLDMIVKRPVVVMSPYTLPDIVTSLAEMLERTTPLSPTMTSSLQSMSPRYSPSILRLAWQDKVPSARVPWPINVSEADQRLFSLNIDIRLPWMNSCYVVCIPQRSPSFHFPKKGDFTILASSWIKCLKILPAVDTTTNGYNHAPSLFPAIEKDSLHQVK